jgi:hypothetical protein
MQVVQCYMPKIRTRSLYLSLFDITTERSLHTAVEARPGPISVIHHDLQHTTNFSIFPLVLFSHLHP